MVKSLGSPYSERQRDAYRFIFIRMRERFEPLTCGCFTAPVIRESRSSNISWSYSDQRSSSIAKIYQCTYPVLLVFISASV